MSAFKSWLCGEWLAVRVQIALGLVFESDPRHDQADRTPPAATPDPSSQDN